MNRFKINEIFYSLQGEGWFTGTPASFIRFSGCNLKCPFCDTRHESGMWMTTGEVLDAIAGNLSPHVVLTGGEPSLFVTEELIEALHAQGRFVAIETNGTMRLPAGIDWVTCSPKFGLLPAGNGVHSAEGGDQPAGNRVHPAEGGDQPAGNRVHPAEGGPQPAGTGGQSDGVGGPGEGGDAEIMRRMDEAGKVVLERCNELKVVYVGQDMRVYDEIAADHRFVQPCDTGRQEENLRLVEEAVEFCKLHPEWRLSLQTHKFLGIR